MPSISVRQPQAKTRKTMIQIQLFLRHTTEIDQILFAIVEVTETENVHCMSHHLKLCQEEVSLLELTRLCCAKLDTSCASFLSDDV